MSVKRALPLRRFLPYNIKFSTHFPLKNIRLAYPPAVKIKKSIIYQIVVGSATIMLTMNLPEKFVK